MLRAAAVLLILAILPFAVEAVERDVVVRTNTTIRVMAANLPGNSQNYEAYAIRILQGLKPDIVAIQEFRYGSSSAGELRQFVNTAFGTNYYFYRESAAGYSIPNGVISRFPIRAAGSWDDAEVPDRGFAWAQVDLPGDVDLYVVSVHLKASSSDASTRNREAQALKALISSNFPANAWVVMAGDCNFQSRSETSEPGLATFKTFLSDAAIPQDEAGNRNTNEPRSRPYDYVLPSFNFATNLVPLQIGSLSFAGGLVFDSRTFTQLAAVAPVQEGDSGLGQHMAVLKSFRISHWATNRVSVDEPVLTLSRANALQWNSRPEITYHLEMTDDLVSWSGVTQLTAASGVVTVTNLTRTNVARFYRVAY